MGRKQRSDELLSRRDFNRMAALGGTAALLPGTLASGSQKSGAKPDDTAQAAQEEDGLSAEELAEVAAKYEAVQRKWGSRLSDAERERVRQVLVSHQRLLQPVRAFHVENSDAPAPVLRFLTDAARADYLARVAGNKAGE